MEDVRIVVDNVTISNSQWNELIEKLDIIADFINIHGNNIAMGMRILLYIGVAFFIWKVITVLYRLFGGIFFGGI